MHPLEDPVYAPVTRPVNGSPHPDVAKWGAASQVRWFQRFWGSSAMPTVLPKDAALYYCQSIEHRGPCCESCYDDVLEGWDDGLFDEHCCCRALHGGALA